MSVMIVDVAAERHAECLAVLHAGFGTVAAEFGLTAQNTPSSPAFWGPDQLARAVARPADLVAVEDSGRLVGCAFVGASRRRPGVWELRHLAVLPQARRRGHGEALVAEAARRARSGGASVLRIGIIAENRRLSGWYEALGFVTVAAGQRFPGLVFSVDHLELSLEARSQAT
jgi:ribosomal protein S18 acetylase RimI-like enzyme